MSGVCVYWTGRWTMDLSTVKVNPFQCAVMSGSYWKKAGKANKRWKGPVSIQNHSVFILERNRVLEKHAQIPNIVYLRTKESTKWERECFKKGSKTRFFLLTTKCTLTFRCHIYQTKEEVGRYNSFAGYTEVRPTVPELWPFIGFLNFNFNLLRSERSIYRWKDLLALI